MDFYGWLSPYYLFSQIFPSFQVLAFQFGFFVSSKSLLGSLCAVLTVCRGRAVSVAVA